MQSGAKCAGYRSPALVVLPIGVMALVYVDPIVLRWFIAPLVLLALVALASGWRYHGRPTVPASLGVGVLAGFGGGAVQIARAAAADLLAQRRQQRGDRARQHHGLFRACRPLLAMVMYYLAARCSPARRSCSRFCSACHSRWRWRPASIRFTARARCSTAASPTSSSRSPAMRQPAGVRLVAVTFSERYALIFCTSASDTSKLA